MTIEKAIEKLTYARQNADEELDPDWCEALDMAIGTLEKQKAISELQPPTDNWETYADRLYDLAYLNGYTDGLIAKRGD